MVTVIDRAFTQKSDVDQRFNVAPIGSCRVTAPLRLAQSDYGFDLNKTRNYGYCHSPAEAVQQVRFMQGQLALPQELWPLIARGVDYNATQKAIHRTADLYVVELSSSKEITIDGICVQLNYLTAQFSSFFENNGRARHFWDHAAAGDQDAIDANLQGAKLPEKDIAILRRIRLHYVDAKGLRESVDTLQDLLPNVLFVSHIDAQLPDGTTLASRSEFIEMVRRVVVESGAMLYDPTQKMREIGQRAAIADHSEGLAHFTEDFSRVVVRDWYHLGIAPSIDRAVLAGDDRDATRLLVPHIEALIQHGELDGVTDRLDQLIDQRPDLKVINRLRYQVAAAQSDAAASYARLKELRAQDPEDIATMRKLRDAAIEMRRFDTALDCIEALAARGQSQSAQQLLHLGQLAMKAQNIGVAITLYQNAFLEPGKSRKAARLFAQAALDYAPSVLDDLSNAQSKQLLTFLPADMQLRVLVHLQVNDPEENIDLSELGAEELGGTIRAISDLGEIPRAAALVSRWMIEHDHVERLPLSVRPVIDCWLARAGDQTAMTDAIALLNSAQKAAPHYPAVQRATRLMRKTIISRMKSHVANNDNLALDCLATEVRRFPLPLPELALARARLNYVAGNFAKTLEQAEVAAEQWDDNISVWVLMMRASSKLGRDDQTQRAANRVLALSDPSTQRLEVEAQDRLRQIRAA